MRILLTAYGPFHDIEENITERIAYEIQKNWDNANGELVVLKLPVEWAGAEALLLRTLQELRPDVVVSLGHAETYPAITVETRYFNVAKGEDNRGETRDGEMIRFGAKAFYDTNIDADRLAQYLLKNNIPAVLHAGKEGMTYLCNFTGYIVMREAESHKKEKPLFIFLHLPPKAIPFSDLVRGATTVIEYLTAKARP